VRGEARSARRGALHAQAWVWLSEAARGRRLDLRVFSPGLAPRGHHRLLDRDEAGATGLFGAPTLIATPGGSLAAFTTLDQLFVARFDQRGRPQGAMRQVGLPRVRAGDPRCSLAVATATRRFVLAVTRSGAGTTRGVWVALDGQGRPLRSPVVLGLPPVAGPGCPLSLVAAADRLLLAGLGRRRPDARAPRLFVQELQPDGRPVERPRWLEPAESFGGLVPTADGALLLWRAARQPETSRAAGAASQAAGLGPVDRPGPIRIRALRCR